MAALALLGSTLTTTADAGAAARPVSPRPATATTVAKPGAQRAGHRILPAPQNTAHGTVPAIATVAHLDPRLGALAGVPGAPATDPVTKVNAHGTVEVAVTGTGAAIAARSAGGRVLSQFAGTTLVAIRPSALRSLAAQPGVAGVSPGVRARVQDSGVTSEGVAASNASAWQAAAPALGNSGQGVNVGVVDLGFGNLAAEISAGHLPAGKVHYTPATPGSAQDKCADDSQSDHGTAVAEIVHQMAPNADIYLYCVDDSSAFAAVADGIARTPAGAANRLKVVTSSLGFIGEGRGDGNDGPGSTEYGVKEAREAGVLWVQSAGNYARTHWSGTLTDANRDGLVDMPDPGLQYGKTTNEMDATLLDPQTSGWITLSWDQWPTTKLPIALKVTEYGHDSNGNLVLASPAPGKTNPTTIPRVSGGPPVIDYPISNSSTTDYHQYNLSIVLGGTVPQLRYDLTYDGDTYPSMLADADPAHAAAGSIVQPASSQYAVAAGAAYWQNGALEPFSSQGPTIDGRVKPDITGYDGVSTNISDMQASQYDSNGNVIPGTTGFYGTSAAAPHVAGAAVLAAAANPGMDASELEAFLESPRNGAGAVDPGSNASGHGLLNLGAADANQVHPAAGSAYFSLPQPVRVIDTRTGMGVRKGPMGGGTELSYTVPQSVAGMDLSNATSVVVEVSGTAAKGGTFLSVYSTSFGGNATLPLSSTEANATITSIVKLNSAHGFKLRNQAAATDALVTLIGYFGPAGGSGGLGYVPLASRRLLDTRVPTGGPKGPLQPNQSVTVDAGVPSDATVAVVNVTALNHKAGGYLTTYPASNPAVATVNYALLARPNLALVPLTGGKFVVQNRAATADAMIDIVGYFSPSAAARFVALPAPVRIADTRSGNGGRHGALGNGNSFGLDAGGLYGVPYDVSGLWVGLTAIGTTPGDLKGNGYLTIYPSGTGQPHASNLDFTGTRSILNNGIATLSGRTAALPPGFVTADTGAPVNVIEDAYGYFETPAS